MKKLLVRIYNTCYYSIVGISNFSLAYGAKKENAQLLKIFRDYQIPKSSKILDVGCGYGRILKLLSEKGYNPIGVDINPEIVKSNVANGLNCLTTEEFKQHKEQYDIILMCHIIEHMTPSDLLTFMDYYLDNLSEKGKLIIMTPIYTKAFYTDFDHIKPYSHIGISGIFSGKNQVQYYSKNKLAFLKINYCNVPYNHRLISTRFHGISAIKQWLIDLIFLVIYCVSFSLIAINVNWMGVYEKRVN